jgi:site-specific recombinase XerC
LGVPATIATQGDNLASVAEGVANTPGAGMRTLRQNMEQQHRDVDQRLTSAFDRHVTAGDFNPDTGAVFIQPSKSGKGRHVPLNAEGRAFFEKLVATKAPADRMLTRSSGAAWGTNHHVRPLADACAKAKIEPAITFHELRHTYASLLAQAGADLLTISKLLGHADTRITARHYAHLCDRTLANTVNALLPAFGAEPATNVKPIKPKRSRTTATV